eukprot:TRINITY_DN6278_c0_g1_i1.p1 TRINITY_DN6278_c0_g1~~TRINITY_DN6278_c0_g1_i1.p1  ORF type:complete len:440 (+),score=67.13 TRINITY_DN6278_c0_g1_i1:6-1325(+)
MKRAEKRSISNIIEGLNNYDKLVGADSTVLPKTKKQKIEVDPRDNLETVSIPGLLVPYYDNSDDEPHPEEQGIKKDVDLDMNKEKEENFTGSKIIPMSELTKKEKKTLPSKKELKPVGLYSVYDDEDTDNNNVSITKDSFQSTPYPKDLPSNTEKSLSLPNFDLSKSLNRIAEKQKTLSSNRGEILTDSKSKRKRTEYKLKKLPEFEKPTWNYVNNKWNDTTSSLSAHRCWKCNKIGHFADDCTKFENVAVQSTSDPDKIIIPTNVPEYETKKGNTTIYNQSLRKMYQKCMGLSRRIDLSCSMCGIQSNLAYCLDCDTIFCDGYGHLSHHLKQNPSHNRLYSAKLKRQVKCCKSTCQVSNIYNLLNCQHCLETMTKRHYNMHTATWSEKGIKFIPNAVCCEDHFEWHLANCESANIADHVITTDKLNSQKCDTVSEQIF